MKMKKVLALTMTAAVSAALLAGCGGSGAASSGQAGGDKVIKIGVFEPTTGENGGGGFQEVLGMRYANKTHPTVKIGNDEYKVELVEVDNKSDKTEAVNAAQKLVSEKVSVVLGSYGSGVSIAAGQIFADAKIPAIGASCTNPQVTQGNDFYFRTCFLDPFQGTVMANYAIDNGAKTAAVITQLGDDYSSGLGSFFKTAFADLGGSVVSEEQFQTNQTDFKAILTNIKAQNPDIIFAPSSITTAPLIIKQARELGYDGPIFGGDTLDAPELYQIAGEKVDGVIFTTFYDAAQPATELTTQFLEAYAAKYGKTPAATTVMAFDCYLTMRNAIETAGSTDPEALREALFATSGFVGAAGTITLDENHDAIRPVVFKKVNGAGPSAFLALIEP